MTNKRIAVVTTFPNEHFNICAAEMLATFKAYWPEDIKIYIQLDEQPEAGFRDINNKIIDILGQDRCFISGLFDEDQKSFKERWKDHKPRSYLDSIVKFSHKVFALEKCADAVKDVVDVLIWLDADVITKKTITHEYLNELLPADDEVCSFLGRDTLHSECGFVAYNLKAGGYELLQQMKNEYVLGSFTDYKTGLTDCHVFDFCRQGKKTKNLSSFFKYGKDDIDVWSSTKLAERMVHRKGNRKMVAAEHRDKVVKNKEKLPAGGVVDAGDIRIKTRNCLDHEKIRANVSANISQIRDWARILRPSPYQDIVMCAAGPSLVNHIDDIKALQSKGAKVVAVKHAIDTLKAHGVKPWAVVLLDPRAHVEGFVKNPDQDVVYFVCSMCDPSVVKTLNDNKCHVIGYHAYVNAGETSLMIHSDLPVSGGSATSTRSLGLFGDMYGYRNFHLFGYDLSHPAKPDLNAKTEDGQPKFMEITIGVNSHKNKYVTRTFWTEGQFLAQHNELKEICANRKDINITIYGDGLAGWYYKHTKLYKAWRAAYNENLESKRIGAPTLDEYVNAVRGGIELNRGN